MATQGSPLSIFQDAPRSRDRRRSVRQKVHSPAYASFDGIGGGMVLDLTEISDISEAGLSLQSPSILTPNRALNLVLDLSETKTYINTTGYVVWTDQAGRVGLRFSKMPDTTRQQLKQWLFFNAMAGAAKALEPEPESKSPNVSTEILVPSEYGFNPVESGLLATWLKPTLQPEAAVVVADAPTLNSIQEQVDALGSDTFAALHLLVERAQAMTRAAGAAIALSEGTEMVCRASAGEAPPVGARFHIGSGFSGECVRTAKLQRCDDTEVHPFVDRESCRALGIRSMIAAPITERGKVHGLLEVFSPAPYAFEETDVMALRRISDIIAKVAEKQNQRAQQLAELATTPHSDELVFAKKSSPVTTKALAVLRDKVTLISAAAVIGVAAAGLLGYEFLQRSPAPVKADPPAAVQTATNAPPSITTLESLRRYATQGDPVAQFALGARYAQGDGVKQDYPEAVRWFTKAAEQGHVVSQATLGAYYWAGRGVQQDLNRAYFWSVLARAGGDEASKYRVAALTSRLTRGQASAIQREAEQWLRQHQSTTPIAQE
jgi:putative methionine-R-sulfoxide reductase with GAF domain